MKQEQTQQILQSENKIENSKLASGAGVRNNFLSMQNVRNNFKKSFFKDLQAAFCWFTEFFNWALKTEVVSWDKLLFALQSQHIIKEEKCT